MTNEMLILPELRGPNLRQVELAKETIQLYEAALKEQKINATVKCGSCDKVHGIANLTYFQGHFYVPPRGCTEGDYWLKSEGSWKCPDCLHVNRLYDRPEVCELKPFFKNVEDQYAG